MTKEPWTTSGHRQSLWPASPAVYAPEAPEWNVAQIIDGKPQESLSCCEMRVFHHNGKRQSECRVCTIYLSASVLPSTLLL